LSCDHDKLVNEIKRAIILICLFTVFSIYIYSYICILYWYIVYTQYIIHTAIYTIKKTTISRIYLLRARAHCRHLYAAAAPDNRHTLHLRSNRCPTHRPTLEYRHIIITIIIVIIFEFPKKPDCCQCHPYNTDTSKPSLYI